MDINDLRGLSTVFAMVAFLGVCYWAYSGRKKQDFEEAAALPFADDAAHSQAMGSDANNMGMKNKKDKGAEQ